MARILRSYFSHLNQEGHTEIAKVCIDAAKADPQLLKEMLLAGFPGKAPARGFWLACEKGHKEIAQAYLDAIIDMHISNMQVSLV